MTLYAKYFSRKNFYISPPLEEKVCVIFETDVPYDDDNIEEFEEIMWSALFKQYPLWRCLYSQANPPPNAFEMWRHSWSSPSTEGKLVVLIA